MQFTERRELKLVPSLGVQTPVRMLPQPEEGKIEYRGAGKRWTVDVAVVTDGCRADSGPVLFTMLLASQGRVCFWSQVKKAGRGSTGAFGSASECGV